MNKLHDWTGFADEMIAIINKTAAASKESRTTRTSRTSCERPLRHSDNFGTTRKHEAVRLENNSYQSSAASRTAKGTLNQHLGNGGTTGTSGTSDFQQGRTTNHAEGAPAEWHAILAELERRDPVEWLPPDRWIDMLFDAGSFLARWGNAADRLGWTALDLFGVQPSAPASRFDAMGLLLLIQGGTVVALTAETATIRRRSNAVLTYRPHRDSPAVLLSQVQA